MALFWWRFRKVLNVIRGSRATPDFEVSPLGPRIRQFLWEVMLQGKVIEQRPLPGLAHAFVYWGFLRLRAGHDQSPRVGIRRAVPDARLGLRQLLFRLRGGVGRRGGGLDRRTVRAPLRGAAGWLGKVAPESGFIALLIFTLMVTYLAGLVDRRGIAAGQGVWWLHTLALLIFLPLIPHTKHLHLVLSPATVFLKRQGFSRFRRWPATRISASTPART